MEVKYFFAALLCFGVSLQFFAQVTIDPPFPQEDDNITVYFDASQGTGGLKNCGCDIYIHAGLITNASTSNTDWKNVPTQWGVANPAWKMTPVTGQPDIYQISYNIRSFYSLAQGIEVQKLAFVFRNADGSQEGKGPGGADILYDLLPPGAAFELRLFTPVEDILGRAGNSERVFAATTSTSTGIRMLVDGIQVSQTSRSVLDTNIVLVAGSHTVELVATQAGAPANQTSVEFNYFGSSDLPATILPAGREVGYTDLGNGRGAFYLYAPLKERALIRGSWNGFSLTSNQQMRPLDSGLGFYIEIDNLPANGFQYQYLVEGSSPIADPFSELITDPNNDRFISNVGWDTLPGMLPVPGPTTWVRPEVPFNWANDSYTRPEEKDLVIYELLIRDFTAAHSYQSLIDSLDYFERLGINAIELMPVNEFEGNLSWGYNPSYHMALDKYYGPPEDFKAFVDAAHETGIAVIIDVVFNHGFGQNPYVQLYATETASAPDGAGPFYNQQSRHPFNVGTDANHESIHTKKYVGRILRHMIEEFHVDGFRFDLSKGFTQIDYGNDVGAWGGYDAGRVAILKAYQDSIRNVDAQSYVILEHFGGTVEERELTEAGMFVWGNMNFNYTEAAMGYSNNSLYGVTPESRGFNNPRLIGYMESHDEERMVYKIRAFGASQGGYSTKAYANSLGRVELASCFFYTTPGAKMLWQFGEYGYDVNIDFNGRTGEKPIKWDLLETTSNRRLFDVTRALIGLRRDYPTFADGTHQLPTGLAAGFTKSMYIEHPEMDAVVVGNFGLRPLDHLTKFPRGGTYYEYFTGDSLILSTAAYVDESLTLVPGEYRLYTSNRLPPPPAGYNVDVSSLNPVPSNVQLKIYPSPARDDIRIEIKGWESATIQIEMYDDLGRVALKLPFENGARIDVSNLPRGTYSILMRDNLGNGASRLVTLH